MVAGIFSYLTRKLRSSFEASNWDDDGSRIFENRYLGDMEKNMQDMDGVQQDIMMAVKKVEQMLSELKKNPKDTREFKNEIGNK